MTEAINESSEVIKNSDRAMKTVILYEALQKKPIFGSYRRFCKLVGNDTIDYPDFEFWYYRFYRGQTGFDYDRSMQIQCQKLLMDMPVSLMYKITASLDTVERTKLRTVNKSIKDVVDSHATGFQKINIIGSDDYLNWELNDKKFSCYKKENGCVFSTPTKRIKSYKGFIKKSLEYLTPLFKTPKIQVNHLSLTVLDQMPALDDLLPAPFHAKSAKHVQLKIDLNENDLLKFSHLERFKCDLTYLEPVDFQRVREIISTFEELESCELIFYGDFDRFCIRIVARALEAEIPFGPLKTIKHLYQIPESNEYLEFEIVDDEYYCTMKIRKIR
ncbi:unnamed protein product [Caenorhabditis nigoni]